MYLVLLQCRYCTKTAVYETAGYGTFRVTLFYFWTRKNVMRSELHISARSYYLLYTVTSSGIKLIAFGYAYTYTMIAQNKMDALAQDASSI